MSLGSSGPGNFTDLLRSRLVYGLLTGGRIEGVPALALWAELNRIRAQRRLRQFEAAEAGLREFVARLGQHAPGPAGGPAGRRPTLFAAAWVELGRVYELQGQAAAAREAFERAAAAFADGLTPNTPVTGQEASDYGTALKRLGRPDADHWLKRGEKLLRGAAKFGAEDPTSVVALAENLDAQGEEAAAAETYSQAALALTQAGQPDQALPLIDRALELKVEDVSGLLVIKGLILQGIGRSDEALELFERAGSLSPAYEPALLLSKAEALQSQGKHRDALDLLLSVNVDDLPDKAAWYRLAAESLYAEKEYHQAARAIAGLLRLRPDDGWALAKQGQLLLAQDKPQEAVEALRRAVAVAPSLDWAYLNLAEALRRAGRLDEALAGIEQCLRRASLPSCLCQLLGKKGQVLRAKGRYREAVEALEEALRFDPNRAWLHAELGEALRLEQRYADALKAVGRALELDDSDAWAWRVKGATLNSLGQGRPALRALDESLKREPESVWGLGLKGRVLSDMARYQEAAECLETACRLAPHLAWLHGLRGWVYQDLGEECAPKMLGAYQTAVSLEDGFNWAWQVGIADALLLLAGEQPEKKKEAAAKYRELLERAGKVAEPDVGVLTYAGWCHYQLGESAPAEERYVKALELDYEAISVRFDLGLVQLWAGKSPRALQEYRRALMQTSAPNVVRRCDLLHVAMEDLRQAVRRRPQLRQNEELRAALAMLKSAFEAAAPFDEDEPSRPLTPALRFAAECAAPPAG